MPEMSQQSHPHAPFKRREAIGQTFFDFNETFARPAQPEIRHSSVSVIEQQQQRLPAVPSIPAELKELAEQAQQPAPIYLTDARVVELIAQAINRFRPGEIRAVKLRFRPFRATLYSVIFKGPVAHVKFHVAFRHAPETVVLQAAHLMCCRSSKTRRSLPRLEFDRFVRRMGHGDFKLPGARKSTKRSSDHLGVHRNLAESFQRVNAAYFSGQLKQPELCWSPARARRILGSYQERVDRLIVSRVFDSPNVPVFVLDFLMYHELLHKFLGIGERRDGRRCLHGTEFKQLERKYARYAEVQAFLKKL